MGGLPAVPPPIVEPGLPGGGVPTLPATRAAGTNIENQYPGATFNITIQAYEGMDGRKLADELERELERRRLRGGGGLRTNSGSLPAFR